MVATETEKPTPVGTIHQSSSAVKPTKLPFETPIGAEEESMDGEEDSLEPLGELLVTDMDVQHDVAGDDAVTPSAGAGNDKLRCSYKKCSNKLLSKEQLPCVVASCKKKHTTCFHHYLRQSSFDIEVREDVFCCAMKACCSKFRVGNQGPTTRWASDGPNGPNAAPNSETILVDWWTTGDNWCVYGGGKKGNGKTTTTKKEQTWKMLSQRIAATGITVSRNAKAVGAKIAQMEGEYKNAFDFVTNTGQGLMNEGKDITEIVKKMCPYFYELDPIMGSRASTHPLELFDSAGIADDVSSDSDAKDDDANDEDYMDNANDVNEGDDEVSSVGAENSYVKETKDKNKRPLSLPKKKPTKMHPAVELLRNLSTAVEKAASQKVEKLALEL
jgi:hypothetical protein